MAKTRAETPRLSNEQRLRLEEVLLEFDRQWTPDAFEQYVDRLDSDGAKTLALIELILVDLERHWSSGRQAFVEHYLGQFPELVSTPDVLPQLVHGEYQARDESNQPLEWEELRRRFPEQAEQVRRQIDKARDSQTILQGHSDAQASIDTSHSDYDTSWGRKSAAKPLPQRFGRYRIIRQLGAGAMGAVYLAHDTQLDRNVALKTPSLGDGEGTSALVERFYREARAAATLRHHNICTVHDVGQIDGTHYISMAYIEGRPLSDYTNGGKPLAERTTAIVIRKLAQALAVAHAQGIVHRDLKPANIMIDKSREPVVMDFGLALQLANDESKMTRSGVILGTPAYMSPEQIEGEHEAVGPKADQYSLGVILYEMLCGQLPFTGSVAAVIGQILTKAPQTPSTQRDEVDVDLEKICLKMMAKSASDRFASMDEVADVIGRWLKTSDGVSPAVSSEARTATTAMPVEKQEPAESVSEVSERAALPRVVTATASTQPTKPAPRRSTPRHWRPVAMAAAGGLVILAIVLMLSTSEGTLRIEVSDPNLQVLVDDNAVNIKDKRWEGNAKARNHRLTLRLGEGEIPFDAAERRFVTKDGRIRVQIDDVELASNRFAVRRRGTTVLKIELLPDGLDGPLASRATGKGDRASDWGNATPKLVRRFNHQANLTARSYFAVLSPDGERVAHWMEHEAPVQMFETGATENAALPDDMKTAIAMDYNANGKLCATGHEDGTVRVWNTTTLQPIGQPFLTDANNWVRWVSLSSDGARALAITSDSTLHVWEVSSRKRTVDPITLDVKFKRAAFAATSDAATLVVADSLGTVDSVKVWDVATGQARETRYVPRSGDPQIVFDVDISANGKLLAVGCKKSMAFVFDVLTGDEVWSASHGDRVSAVCLSVDARQLATCGGPADSEDLHLWDLSTGKELVRWHAPADASRRTEMLGAWITMLEFSHDGSRLLTAGSNTPICLWSLVASDGTSPGAPSTANSAKPEEPPTEGDLSDNRVLAEKLLNLQGAVGRFGPGRRYIYRIPQLPQGDLRISHVAFYGINELVKDEHIGLLANVPELETLGLGRVPSLTDDGYKALAQCKNLKELTFIGSALNNSRLADLKELPLNNLYLWHTDVTNAGLNVLAEMRVLRRLTLGNSRKTHRHGPSYLTDAGLAELAAIPELHRLWLYGPGFTDDAVEHLSRLKELGSLTLGTPELTDAGIAELRRQLPKCEIIDKRGVEIDEPENETLNTTDTP